MAIDFGDNNTEHGIPMGAYVPSSGGGGGQIEWVTFPNAVILGEPQINGSQVSGFSTEDYMMFPFILDVHDRPFEVNFSFTTGDDVTTQQNILDSQFGLALAIQNGHGLMAISNNGESWAGTAAGLLDIMPNTTYYAKLTWNRLQYKTALSVDGKTFIDDMAITNATRPYPRTMFIGGGSVEELGHTTHPFQGVIDMKNASLLVDGNTVWLGMDDPGLATRADVSLSNLDAAGEARFTAKQDKLIAMDGVMIEGNEISANVDGTTVKINGSGQLEAVGGCGTGDLRGVAPIKVDDIQDVLGNIYIPSDAPDLFRNTRTAGDSISPVIFGYSPSQGYNGFQCIPNADGKIDLSQYIHKSISKSDYNKKIRMASQTSHNMLIGKLEADGTFNSRLHFTNLSNNNSDILVREYNGETTVTPVDATKIQCTQTGEVGASNSISFGTFSPDSGAPYYANIYAYVDVELGADNAGYLTVKLTSYYADGGVKATTTYTSPQTKLADLDVNHIIWATQKNQYYSLSQIGLYDGGTQVWNPSSLTEYTQVSFEGDFVAVPVIIDSHVDGASGYRVWSKDKTGYNYCEQWGYNLASSGSVTFLKTFKDTDYYFNRCNKSTSSGTATNFASEGWQEKTVNSITIFHTSGYTDGEMWEAKGYLAKGQYDD